MAPGADLSAAPSSFAWTDLTPRVADKSIAIARGRRSGAVGAPEPISASLTLSAATTATDSLVARKATSTYYPYIRKGLAVRHYVNQGARYLNLTGATGSRATTPDAASLDIVGDLYVAVEYRAPIITPVTNDFIKVVGKWDEVIPAQSWEHDLGPFGIPYLIWTTDGLLGTAILANATMPIPCPDQGPLSLGIYLDVNNGAGGWTLYFWAYKGTIVELNAALTVNERRWRLGAPATDVGVTSIFSGSAPLGIGDIVNSSVPPYASGINAVEVRAGNWTGTVAANPNFKTQTAGAGSFADTAAVPKTWTINAPAAITDRKIRLLGQLASNGVDLPGHGLANTAQVKWDIAGVLRRLRQGEPNLESALFRRITTAHPEQVFSGTVEAYWPLEDARDSTSAYSPTAGVPPMQVGGALTFGSGEAWPASKPMASVPATSPWGLNGTITKSTSDVWEVTWLWNAPTAPAAASTLLVVGSSGTARTWQMTYSSTQVALGVSNAAGSVLELNTFGWISSFQYQSIVRLEAVQNGGNVDYVVTWIPLEGPGAGGATVMSGSFAGTCGRVKSVAAFEPTSGPDGHSIGHIAVTTGTFNSWLAGADQAFTGEAAAARVYRLCSEQGIPCLIDGWYAQFAPGAALNVAMGEQPMGPQLPLKFTDLLDQCALVSGGMIGEATELLGLTFRSGWTLNNQTPTVTTTTATVKPFGPSDDDRDFVNDATVSRTNGSSARYQDPVSAEGHYPDARDINAANDQDLPSQASWWEHEATTPEMRFQTLTFEIAKDPTVIDRWLSTSRGDLLRASSLPAVLPETSTDQLVDGWTEEISTSLWTVTAATRPGRPHEVAVLGDSTRGKLDTGGSQLNSVFVAGTDTSMSVLVTKGQGWVTAGGEFPFDVAVSGARVTVTAIGALAAGVQVFTVSATISNGVNKSIAAGTAVSLWRPSVIGL